MLYTLDRSKNIRRKIVLVAMFIVMLSFTVLFVVPSFSRADELTPIADNGGGDDGTIYTEEDMERDAAYVKLINYVEGSFTETSQDLMKVLHGDTESETVNDLIEIVTDILRAASSILVMVYFIIAVAREFTEGKATSETWIRAVMRLIIVFALIAFGWRLMEFLTDLFTKMLDGILGILTHSMNQNINAYLSETITGGRLDISNWDLTKTLFEDRNLSRGVFVVGLLGLYVRLQKYAILLELVLRQMLFPVATLSIITDGTRSSAVRFMKKYVAVYVRMMLIFITLFVGLSIAMMYMRGSVVTLDGSELAGMDIAIYDVIAIFAACVAVIGKNSKVAYQIVGVDSQG